MSIKKNTEKYVVISCLLVLDMLNFTLRSNLFLRSNFAQNEKVGEMVVSRARYEILKQELSEEILEGKHKEIRYAKECHAGKSLKKNANMDLSNFLISSSNSAVAVYQQKSTKIKRSDYNGIQEHVIMDDSNEELSLNIHEEFSETSSSESDLV